MSYSKDGRAPAYDEYDDIPTRRGGMAAARPIGTSTPSGGFFSGAHTFDINGGEFNQASRDIHKAVTNDHSTKSNFDNDYRESPHYNGQSAHHDFRAYRDARNNSDGLGEYGFGRGRGRLGIAHNEPRFPTNYEQRSKLSARNYVDDDDGPYYERDDDVDDVIPRNRRGLDYQRFKESEHSADLRGPNASETFNAGRHRYERERQDYKATEKDRLVSIFRNWLDTKEDILSKKKADFEIFEEFVKDQQSKTKYGKSSRGAVGEKFEVDPKA
ncbi:hypothetical protein D9757_004743 [Collybiopsis confluens]|uniref:Uncharacterized protein n=1 Tax=Collybiopsis confluens TaxID=2823264 RepID=A0A8H5MCC7_9AGAR|nr:hypothetical protein D9757_004743 [Collybiopsis confluens]